MRRLEASLPGGRVLIALDVALIVWTVAWIAIAIAIGREVKDLAELSDTVSTVGAAAEATGGALDVLGSVPVVGEALDDPAQQIQEAGRSAQESGATSRESVDELSLLLALAVALIPSTPLLALYLPARLGRVREAQAIERARRRSGGDPAFDEFLARRAVQNISFRKLERVDPEPWRDLQAGRYERLARAELDRLGLTGSR